MRNTSRKIILLLLLCLVALGTSCILEEKVLEIVLTDETCADFEENHDSATFVTPAVVDYGSKIEEILAENDVSRSNIVKAMVVSGSYEVKKLYSQNFIISGAITVERLDDNSDGPATIVDYTNQSLEEALGIVIPAVLNPAGVDLLNHALADFIDGDNPILLFKVNNSGVDPTPSGQFPIVFDWRGCIVIHVMIDKKLKVPDPF